MQVFIAAAMILEEWGGAVLGSGLLLLLLEECEEGHARHLHHLEPDTGDVSHGMPLPTEPSDEHLILHIHHGRAVLASREGVDTILADNEVRGGRNGILTFSSIKFRQPSFGTKAAIFFPFFTSWTRAHLRIAELGCLASMPLYKVQAVSCQLSIVPRRKQAQVVYRIYIFSRTIPFAWDEPAKGFFHSFPRWLFL